MLLILLTAVDEHLDARREHVYTGLDSFKAGLVGDGRRDPSNVNYDTWHIISRGKIPTSSS